jgi:hypothetical protein
MNKQKKKNIILLSILGVLALVTVWVLFGKSNNETTITDIFSGGTQTNTIETQKLPSRQIFDESLEQDTRFRELEDLRDYKIDLKSKGRKNPFSSVK